MIKQSKGIKVRYNLSETVKGLTDGITLIALVITIVILLLLAGISISALTDSSFFEKVKFAKGKSKAAGELENSTLKEYEYLVNGYLHTDLIADGTWQQSKSVNSPQLLDGMTPIKFTEPTSGKEGTTVTTTIKDKEWYDYTTKKWANAQTKDGSMWVWIPRYAYRINSSSQTCDVVFLIGTTDNYYDENGNIKTAKRQKTLEETIDTTTGYTVHPAFTNESSINYANGGWDKELSGIWVAKFEAGYASGNNNATVKASSVNYTQTTVWVSSKETGTGTEASLDARNWLDGTYGKTTTSIKYPTFQGLTYSMNYININDAYNISRALTEMGNIYGLNATTTNSHLMKNSEWGAVAYLSQSKYGLNVTNVYINNVSLNNSPTSVYGVTGCAGNSADASTNTTTIEKINDRSDSNIYVWTQEEGQKSSTTGTIYGIYDMSGGLWERTAGLVANESDRLTSYGGSLLNNGVSTKYVTVYPHDTEKDNKNIGHTEDNLNIANVANYLKNTRIYGDAIRETSIAGTGSTSWYSDYSYFPGLYNPFTIRGGDYYHGSGTGLLSFSCNTGGSSYIDGFRAVIVNT